WLYQLQVTPGHLVERQQVAAPQHAGAGEVRQAPRLQLPRVAEQRPDGAERSAVARLDAEPVEGSHSERACQVLARELGIELPRLALGAYGAGEVDGGGCVAGELPFRG